MPTLDRSFFETSKFFKLCVSSREPLLKILSDQLEGAWSSLITNDEAESLMSDVNHLINDFNSREVYPPFDKVRNETFFARSDYYRSTVKWASVYAGLAAIAARRENISDARQLIASSALVLFCSYRPCSEEAYNHYVSRKGGEARSVQRRQLKDELYKLIEKEIHEHREPFNSKKEAAEHFDTPLNEAAKRLKIQNIKESMSKTIQNWFSTDEKLKPLIENLISKNPRRKRSPR